MGLISDIFNAIIGTIVNLVLLLAEIIVLPFRLIGYAFNRLLAGPSPGTGYFSRPWGWSWRRRTYF